MGVKRAIVIGVDEYSDERIRPLPGARYDAREMHDLLGGWCRSTFGGWGAP